MFGTETATIKRAKRVGRDQDIQMSTVDTIMNCLYSPAGAANTRSSTEGQDSQVVTSATLYAPPGAPVPKPTDYVEVRGVVWECDGEASVWAAPDGELQGYEQRLRRVVG